MSELARLLAALGAEMSRASEIGSELQGFVLLVRNRGNHSNPTAVDQVISQLVAELNSLINGIQARLTPFTYPFPHARGCITVAEYARNEKPAENDWHRIYLDGAAHIERLFALHYRLLGRILTYAHLAETSLEKQPHMAEKLI